MQPPPARDPDQAVARLPVDALLSTDQEVLTEWCLSQLGWPPHGADLVQLGQLHHHLNGPTRLTIHVPLLTNSDQFAAHDELMRKFGGIGYNNCGRHRVAELGFDLHNVQDDPNALQNAMRELLQAVSDTAAEQANAARSSINARRQDASKTVKHLVAQRVAIETALAHAKTELGIPLDPSLEASLVPLQPVGLDLGKAMARAGSGEPELKLDAHVRDQILSTIRAFALAVERLPTTAQRLVELDEEALRDVLLFVINSNWRVATGEAFSGRGKTDIQLQFNGKVAFTAELKLYSGPVAIGKAIEQLCSYMVWRDTHAALIIFIKGRKDIAGTISRIRTAVLHHTRFLRIEGDGAADTFVLATADGDRTITLDLIAVPLSTHAITSHSP